MRVRAIALTHSLSSCGWGAISVLWFAIDTARTGKLPSIAADFPGEGAGADAGKIPPSKSDASSDSISIVLLKSEV